MQKRYIKSDYDIKEYDFRNTTTTYDVYNISVVRRNNYSFTQYTDFTSCDLAEDELLGQITVDDEASAEEIIEELEKAFDIRIDFGDNLGWHQYYDTVEIGLEVSFAGFIPFLCLVAISNA